jgi:hypothetical protein
MEICLNFRTGDRGLFALAKSEVILCTLHSSYSLAGTFVLHASCIKKKCNHDHLICLGRIQKQRLRRYELTHQLVLPRQLQ